ncbi:MAG: acyl CoA:acetate/3-ketoacid CoA transferase, partial [Peptococcaceae bacterium]|nr:acyl CoA:acetate/3-ketoacid CoA transferase [Peptococcaceae bacterium]
KVEESIIPFETYAPDGERLVVVRRAVNELWPGAVCNIGIGMPVGIAYLVSKEGIKDMFNLTNELGAVSGHLGGAMFFPSSFNAHSYLNHHEMFDFINGHGLDISFLGSAEVGEDGSVNVTKIAGRIRGSGGFINIAASTKRIVFISSMTVGGESEVVDGALKITKPGKGGKFLKEVTQISFNAKDVAKRGQEIMYVTERAVFKLIDGKVTLIEIAPGLDVEKDVLAFMDFKPEISADLKPMPSYCFETGLIGMKEQWKKLLTGKE